MSKRILSMVLMLTLILGSFSMAFANHTDAKLTTEQKIAELQRLGFIEGDQTGDLKLKENIDRASVAAIVARAVLSGDGTDFRAEINKSNYRGIFADVPQSHWANASVNVATEKQITNGTTAGTPKMFSPSRDITYIEVITMMNRILNLDVNLGNGWKIGNIAAAREAGILEGLDGSGFNYDDKANREVIFELLYNTVTNNKLANYNIDKVLVLENNRVESIGANEIVVEVIKEVQRANFVSDSRDKSARRGEQLRITVPSEVGEVEDLLGKVIDLSYDKTNKAVSAKFDNSYEYKVGSIELESKSLKVDGKSYTVLKDEQYKDSDERIFNTYVNNEDFTYENAVKKYETLDFGKVTIKNGKVLFIDAFAFDDIAPVKEVNKDGNEIVVYNDINDGGTKQITIGNEQVISYKDGKFTKLDKKNISKLDVIHVGEDTKGKKVIVVRQDAQVNGVYDKVVEYKNKTVVVIEGKEYEILTKPAKQPVYSANSDEFRRLEAEYASRDLKGFEKEKVTVLQDVNGNLQYIGAEIDFGEFVGLVERVVGKEARILNSQDKSNDYTTTLDSKLGEYSTGHKNLGDYNRGDVVFVGANKNQIDKMNVLSKYNDRVAEGKTVTIDDQLRFVKAGTVEYRALARTNVFVRNTDAKGNVTMYATTLAHVEKNVEKGSVLNAVIISDKDYAQVDPRYKYDESANILNTIVFDNPALKSDTTKEIVELVSVSNRYEEIKVRFANGTEKTYEIKYDSNAYNSLRGKLSVAGDIVEIGIDKNDDKVVRDINALGNAVAGKVKTYNERTKVLVLENGSEYFLTSNTAIFVKGSIQAGKNVTIYRESPTSKYVSAITDGSKDVGSVVGEITEINRAENLIKVNGEVLLLATTVDLINEKNESIAIGKDQVVAALNKGDVLKDITKNKDGLVVKMVLKDTVVNNSVDSIIAAIVNLPSVADIKIADKTQIAAIRSAYNNLSALDKAKVTNYNTLVAAEAEITRLEGNQVITGEATYISSLLGLRSYDLKINGVDASRVTNIVVNQKANSSLGVEVDSSRTDVIMFNTEENPVNTIQFDVDGTTYSATIK